MAIQHLLIIYTLLWLRVNYIILQGLALYIYIYIGFCTVLYYNVPWFIYNSIQFPLFILQVHYSAVLWIYDHYSAVFLSTDEYMTTILRSFLYIRNVWSLFCDLEEVFRFTILRISNHGSMVCIQWFLAYFQYGPLSIPTILRVVS